MFCYFIAYLLFKKYYHGVEREHFALHSPNYSSTKFYHTLNIALNAFCCRYLDSMSSIIPVCSRDILIFFYICNLRPIYCITNVVVENVSSTLTKNVLDFLLYIYNVTLYIYWRTLCSEPLYWFYLKLWSQDKRSFRLPEEKLVGLPQRHIQN